MRKNKTTEQFKEEVYNLVKDEYIILGEYINSLTKTEIKHNKCGHIYEISPKNFLKGNRCPKCNGKIKKTIEQFKEGVYSLVKDEYIVIGEYVNNKTKIKIKHNECGHIYEVAPNNFLKGNRCPKCNGVIKKTTDSFKKEVYNLVKDEYTVLGEYINNANKIKMKHNICGYNYEIIPNSFLSGRRCPKCSGFMKKTTEQFKKEVYNLVNDEYTVLGKYINNATKIKMKHNICGYNYEIIPNSFLQGNRCPKCNGVIKKTTDSFKKEVYNLVKDEYTVLGEYISSNSKIEIKHNKCNHFYKVAPNSFLRGRRCPKCKLSKGETKILNLLKKYNIKTIPQYKFNDCKHIKQLSFDFAIFNKDKLLCLIEYDGAFHYKYVKRFGGKKFLYENKYRDNIKNKYCLENKISLLRIPYWEFKNIDKIILKKLYRLNILKALH